MIVLQPGSSLEENRILARLTPHHLDVLIALVNDKLTTLRIQARSARDAKKDSLYASFVNELVEYDKMREYLQEAALGMI